MKKLLLFVLAAVAFAACEQAPIEEQSVIRQEASETITVGFEGDDTRIQLNEAQKTVWTKDDIVSVFYKSNANQKWEYRGETGERVAELYRVDAGTASRDMDYVVLAYPYSTEYVLSTATGNIEATLPAVQHYLKDSYGVGSNLMVSKSEFTQFSLKSVCGWLKLQLTGDGEVVKSITFKGNNGEQVAGLIYVDTATAEATLASEMGSVDDNNAGGSLVFEDTILTEVTLDCGEGVTLGAEATAFYIAIPPQTFDDGFTVEVACVDGSKMVKSSNKALSIERNHIQPMAEFSYTANISPSNQIWYTSSDGNIVEPYNTDVFGANIISNTYNNGMGVITFDGVVTTIGDDAFCGCDGLTEFTIPDSVTTIGDFAFAYCFSLTSVNIPDSVTTIEWGAFRNCSSLTSVNIPDSVTTIGEDAFSSCDSLTSVNIPDSITTIGNWAFYDCDSLTSVTIGDSVTTIGDGAFRSCDSLKEFTGKFAEDNGRILVVDGVLTAFAPAGITEYNIPDSVTTIGYQAFRDCDSLTSVNIPDSVTTIGDLAFFDCSSLTSVNIPDSVTTIGEGAFRDCDSLISVNIPDSVTTIGDGAFAYCDSLTDFTGKFAEDNGRILVVDGVLTAFAPVGITEYNIPDSVTTIGYQAFDNCTNLTSVNIPDSVTTIGNYAFRDCTSLTSVNIPGSVTTIGGWAFECCTSLTSVNIPDSVTSIEYGAFEYCTSLTSVYCKATTPPSLGNSSVFDNNGSGRKIYVPAESVDAYKSAQYWSEYASMIVSDPMVYTVLGSYDPNKYITYVEDYDYRGYGDAFDYNVYYYGTTIYSDGLLFSSKVECKFRLNSFSSGTFYISVGEYDDDIYDIYVNTSGLNIGDELYTWGDMGVSKTDVITLTLSGTTMVVNGKTISGIPSVGYYLDGYIWSGHYHERDDGMWWMDYTFQDGARIYYAKGWNSAGDLIYLGGASLSADGRACWKSTYSEYGTGNIITKEHFPRVTSSFGRGNL